MSLYGMSENRLVVFSLDLSTASIGDKLGPWPWLCSGAGSHGTFGSFKIGTGSGTSRGARYPSLVLDFGRRED